MCNFSQFSAWRAYQEQRAIAEMHRQRARLEDDKLRAVERKRLRAKIMAEHKGLTVIEEAPLLLEHHKD